MAKWATPPPFGKDFPADFGCERQPWGCLFNAADKKDLFPILRCKFIIGHRQVFDSLD